MKLVQLEALEPFNPEDEELRARWDAMHDYFGRSAARWYRDGIQLDPATLAGAAALWKRRVDLRLHLNGLVLWYPCPEFKRAFLRAAKEGSGGDYAEWFRLFPDVKAHLRSTILARARRFNQPFPAIYACTIWARYYDGGDDAYRQIALTINRDDRRQARRREPSDFLRHDLETHGTLRREEAEQINRFLLDLEAEPLHHWR